MLCLIDIQICGADQNALSWVHKLWERGNLFPGMPEEMAFKTQETQDIFISKYKYKYIKQNY